MALTNCSLRVAIRIIHPKEEATVVAEVSYRSAEEWQLGERVMSLVWTLDHHLTVSSVETHHQVLENLALP